MAGAETLARPALTLQKGKWMIFRQSLRMTWRDWRAGELYFLLIALVIAVSALSSVGFFVDRMRAGLQRDAHQLLGADLVVSADQPVDPAWRKEAQRRGLTTADTVVFPSMAIAGEGDAVRSQLSSVKAVSPGYPLRGVLKLATRNGADTPTTGIPSKGSVWVDRGLLSALQLKQGDSLRLGDRSFTIDRTIAIEPDRGSAFVNFAPRVMLHLDDLESTGLVQVGSRITYRLLVKGDPAAVSDFRRWSEEAIERDSLRGVRIESLESGRPEMQATLERAEQFLSLVGLLSAILAAVAIAMAARRFMIRHLDSCAMLRCLGLTQSQVTTLYVSEFALVGLAGSLLGVLAGFAAHFALLELLGRFIVADLPPPGILPAAQGVLTGMLLLIGFALPPVLQLRNVPHNRVIRREQQPPKPIVLTTYIAGTAAFIALLLWQSGNVELGLMTAGGFLGGSAAFALVAWLSLRLLQSVRSAGSSEWRFAINALLRRPAATVVQIVALSLGLMALLLLTVIRGDLVDAWRQSVPDNAPNRFVINIQPDQKSGVESLLKGGGIADVELYPMIRGRLVEVNGEAVNEESYEDDRPRRLVTREFNLSALPDLPRENRVVEGEWYDNAKPEASVEQGLAKTLGLKLGDIMTFDIAGQKVSAPITSLRKLNWGSMRVNFFVILNPSMVADMPQSWITAFHLPADKQAVADALARDYPNLTIVDVSSIIRQIQTVLDRVVIAVEFLFMFTLASGVLVLYAALVGTQDERSREAALLRALGATRSQLSRSQRIEFLLTGGLAGLLAATGAAVTGWVLARFVFNFEWAFSPTVWLAGIPVGALCAFAGGWLGLRNVLHRPPLQTLREA
jgi:putative ABC transport system permease protein